LVVHPWRHREISAPAPKNSPLDRYQISRAAITRCRCRGGPSGWAGARMKATGRRMLAPTRHLLLNHFWGERVRSTACKPVCHRCLHTLQPNAWLSQKIGRLPAIRTRHRRISSCGFWHEETRRRRGPTVPTRPLATVQEGKWFSLPGLYQTNRPRSTWNM
jgi:hypothetical protein